MAFYDGQPIFGISTVVRHQPNLTSSQISAFFGLTGNQSLFGGGRGRGFLISGVFPGFDPAGCVASEAFMLSYADGIARLLVDNVGYPFPNVCFYGDYQRTSTPQFLSTFDGTWILPYKAVFIGLT